MNWLSLLAVVLLPIGLLSAGIVLVSVSMIQYARRTGDEQLLGVLRAGPERVAPHEQRLTRIGLVLSALGLAAMITLYLLSRFGA